MPILEYRVNAQMIAFTLASLLALGASVPAAGQEIHAFNVSALDSPSAIRAFSMQSGIQILASADDLKGKKLNPVNGEIPTENALNDLLAGTGLTHRYVSDRAVALVIDEIEAVSRPRSARTEAVETSRFALDSTSIKQTQEKPRSKDSDKQQQIVKSRENNAVDDQLAEVVVTADRRATAQNIQTVPMAISVIDPETISKLGMSGLSDYARLVPSIDIQEQGSGVNSINIRGLVARGISPSETEDHSLVAIYVDDMPITLKSANPDLKVLDLERIEVLRGPQGTLYGAGAMAGTIRLITAKPDLQRVFGSAEISGSHTVEGGSNNYSVRGMINLPLQDNRLALRLVGYKGEDSGYINNVTLNERRVNPETTTQSRAALRFIASPVLTLDASVTYDKTLGGINSGYAGLADYTIAATQRQESNNDLWLYNFTGDYDAGFARLIFTSSLIQRSALNLSSDDFSTNAFIFNSVLPINQANITFINHVKDFVEELRLTSTTAGPLKWTGGVFFENSSRHFVEDEPTVGLDARYGPTVGLPDYSSVTNNLAFQPNDQFSDRTDIHERQIALFAEGTYTFFDKLDATLGLRYFHESEDFNLFFGGYFGTLPGPATAAIPFPVANTTSSTERAAGVNPRGALAYHVSDNLMVFAEAARGFRYGGNNQPIPLSLCAADLASIGIANGPATFGPDKLWSYSIGEKSTLLDRRLTLNLTAFLIDWSNVQTAKNLNCSYYFTENGGKVRSTGVEFELSAKLAPGLTTALNASYIDGATSGAIANLNAPDGTRTPYSPRQIASVMLDYRLPISAARGIDWSLAFSYKGSAYTDFVPANGDYRKIPASRNLSSALGYDFGHVQVEAFGSNLTNGTKVVDIRAQTNGSPFQPGDTVYYARPRTYGLRVKAKF